MELFLYLVNVSSHQYFHFVAWLGVHFGTCVCWSFCCSLEKVGLIFFFWQFLHHNVIMWYLLCGVKESLVFFPQWHTLVNTCALLISALKSIENCQSGEISFAVRWSNEWAQVCQIDCGKSTRLGRGHTARKTWTQFKATLCNDVLTLEWRLMLQSRLCQFNDLLQQLVKDCITVVANLGKLCQGQEYLCDESINLSHIFFVLFFGMCYC